MQEQTANIDNPNTGPFKKWGFWAVLLGATSLVIVIIQIFGPMLEPSPSIGTQIGEIAGDIKRSAWKTFLGLSNDSAQVEAVSWTSYFSLAAPILGVVAVVLSLVSGLSKENWRFSVYGAGLGATAIIFHFFWWMALIFAGALIIVAIIENIGDIFSF